jgi:cell division protein FtsZ
LGLQELKENVDTLIVIPNQKLLSISSERTPLLETFKKADEVLLQAVKGISDLINIRGLINLDFADIRTVMSSRGIALMGTGVATGENRAVEAATAAISSPLLENISIDGATGIIINVTGGADLSLYEVNEASTLITEAAHEDAEIIFGAVIDDTLGDEIRVTVIATGFEYQQPKEAGHHLAQQMQDFLHRQNIQPPMSMPPPVAPFNFNQVPSQSTMPPQMMIHPVSNQVMAPQPQMVMATPPAMPLSHQPIMPPVDAGVTMPEGFEAQRKMNESVQPTESGSLPRDLLIAKARAFRENQDVRSRGVETGAMNMDEAALEEARRLAREALRNPFSQNFEVPAFLRRKQQGYETDSDKK